MAWVVAVDDLTRFEEKLGRKAVEGHRHTPEGIDLTWRQVGIKGLLADPQLPFFVHWDSMEHHPSTLDESGVRLTALQINGDPSRIRDWLGLDRPGEFEKAIEFGFHGGEPALDAVTFEVDGDLVTL